MSGKGWKSDQLTGKFLAGNFSQSQTELSADFTGLIAPDWFRAPGTLTSAELEAGALDADEAKDYATETIQQHVDGFRARLKQMLQENRMTMLDAHYGLEHADLLLDLDMWMKVRAYWLSVGNSGENLSGSFSLSEISIRAGCGEAECYGQYPTPGTPKLIYAYRFKWSPFVQSTVTTPRGAPAPPRHYPEFPIVQDSKFMTAEKFPHLYADPLDAAKRQVMLAVARYNALTRREP